MLVRILVIVIVSCITTIIYLKTSYILLLVSCLLFLFLMIVETLAYSRRSNHQIVQYLSTLESGSYNSVFAEEYNQGMSEFGHQLIKIFEKVHQTKQKLAIEKQYYEAFLYQVPSVIFTVSDTQQVTLHSKWALRLFKEWQVESVDDLKKYSDELFTAVAVAPTGKKSVITFQSHDSKKRLVLTSGEVRSSETNIKVFSLIDVESEIEFARVQAWHELMSVVTHEIANSISPITSLAETSNILLDDLLHNLKENSGYLVKDDFLDFKRALSAIEAKASSLQDFANRYKSLRLNGTPQLIEYGMKDLVYRTLSSVEQKYVEAAVVIQHSFPEKELYTRIDPSLIEQVLLNLFQNALEELSNSNAVDKVVKLSMDKDGNNILLKVEDNGRGIKKEDFERIFIPYYTSKDSGTGVGLAMAKQIILAHGGELKVSRSSLGGAAFSISLKSC